MGMLRRWQGGGGATLAWWRCWGERGLAGMLRCWSGGGRASVAVRDDGGGGCAIALLGWRRYRGVMAVAGVSQRARCCWGRRAAVMESTTATWTADKATRGGGATTTTSNKSSHSTTQGDNNGGNDGGGDVTLGAPYSQHCLLRV
jgi:hypothetical protein